MIQINNNNKHMKKRNVPRNANQRKYLQPIKLKEIQTMMISSCIKDVVRQVFTQISLRSLTGVSFLAIIFLQYVSRGLKKFIPFDLAILPLGICANKRTRDRGTDLYRKCCVIYSDKKQEFTKMFNVLGGWSSK